MATLKVDTITSADTPTVSITDGASISGVTTFSSDLSISDKIIHTGDTNTAIRFPSNDTINLETGGSKRLEVTDTATAIHEATDKVVRFLGSIGEIGSVT